MFRITPLNRPLKTFSPSRKSPQEQEAAEAAWQAKHAALHAEFERQWEPPPGYSRERDFEEMENIECAAFSVWEERRTGRTAAATTPVWIDQINEWLLGDDEDGPLGKQPTAASLTLPFLLKDGGDMQIFFETEKQRDPVISTDVRTSMLSKLSCLVRTEHGVHYGRLQTKYGERSWRVVSLPDTIPQEVADRVVRTLDAINALRLPDDYLTVMPVSDRCSICQRRLSDLVSKTLGIGPDCAAALRIPHSVAVADAVAVKRQAFTGTAVEILASTPSLNT